MPFNPANNFVAPSYYQNYPANPTAPASTSAYKMQGLAGVIVPNVSGIVVAEFSGTVNWVTSGAVGVGISLQGYYGLVGGVALPVNTGNIPGNAQKWGPLTNVSNGVVLTTIGDNLIPVTLSAVVGGLIVGQEYWFDLAAESLTTASDSFLTNVGVTLFELS